MILKEKVRTVHIHMNAIDPIDIGVHIYHSSGSNSWQERVDPTKACVMTVGKFEGGTAANIIPDTAVIEGTIRSNDKQARELMVRRMKEAAVKTAESYGGMAEIDHAFRSTTSDL